MSEAAGALERATLVSLELVRITMLVVGGLVIIAIGSMIAILGYPTWGSVAVFLAALWIIIGVGMAAFGALLYSTLGAKNEGATGQSSRNAPPV